MESTINYTKLISVFVMFYYLSCLLSKSLHSRLTVNMLFERVFWCSLHKTQEETAEILERRYSTLHQSSTAPLLSSQRLTSPRLYPANENTFTQAVNFIV